MSEFDSPGVALDTPPKRRSASSRFADFGDRIARTFSGLDRVKAEGPVWAPPEDGEYQLTREMAPPWEQLQPPFPIVRHGYDPAAVDDYIGELEQELEELRARTPDQRAISREIDRIGEQTAEILRVAHDKAADVSREAQAQADKCVADAAANALAISEKANRRLSELDAEVDSIWQERARLVEDVRSLATTLFSLAEDAAERYPGEAERGQRTIPIAAPVAGEEADAGS